MSTKLLDPENKLHPFRVGEPACRMGALVDLIGMAAWENGDDLRRGELETSCRKLADRWRWSRQKVSRFFRELEDDGVVTRVTQTGRFVGRNAGRLPVRVSICNYERYQFIGGSARDASRDASWPESVTLSDSPPIPPPIRNSHYTGDGASESAPDLPASPERSRGPDGGRPTPELAVGPDGDYPPAFERLWEARPRRDGADPKGRAFAAWRARLRAGADPGDMQAGVERYAAWCDDRYKPTERRYVMRLVTFLGPDEHFREDWQVDLEEKLPPHIQVGMEPWRN